MVIISEHIYMHPNSHHKSSDLLTEYDCIYDSNTYYKCIHVRDAVSTTTG